MLGGILQVMRKTLILIKEKDNTSQYELFSLRSLGCVNCDLPDPLAFNSTVKVGLPFDAGCLPC